MVFSYDIDDLRCFTLKSSLYGDNNSEYVVVFGLSETQFWIVPLVTRGESDDHTDSIGTSPDVRGYFEQALFVM